MLSVERLVLNDVFELFGGVAEHDLQRLCHAQFDESDHFYVSVPRLVLKLHLELELLVVGHKLSIARIVQLLVQKVKQGHHSFVVTNHKVQGRRAVLPEDTYALPRIVVLVLFYFFLFLCLVLGEE